MLKDRFKKLIQRIYKRYIIVVYNESNLQERVSVSLTPMNLILILSTLLVLGFLLSSLLFIFTPINRLNIFPAREVNDQDYQLLQARIDSLQIILEQQRKVEKSLREILIGDTTALIMIRKTRQAAWKQKNEEGTNKIFHFASRQENTNPLNSRQVKELPLYFRPVLGYITRGFDVAIEHYAVDILTAKDAPVAAISEGYVIFAEWSASTGNVIILQHADNTLSVYKHNSVLLRSAGSYVRQGEVIALTGNTGELTKGPHLHFEIWKNGSPLDPEKVVGF